MINFTFPSIVIFSYRHGEKKSLCTLLKELIPDLQLIKCICHSLNICLAYVCKEVPIVALNFLFDRQEIGFHTAVWDNWRIKVCLKLCMMESLQLNWFTIIITRWLAIGMVASKFKSILEQFLALKAHFNSIANSN